MAYEVIEDVEDRVGDRVNTDGRGVIVRYDNENETPGRHECHTPEGVESIDFPGMLALRDRFMTEIDH